MATNVPCGFLGKAERRRVQAVSFSVQLPRAVQGLKKISSHLPQKEVGKCQQCQSSEDDKETNKTKRRRKNKKNQLLFSPNNSRNTNMVL